MLAAGKENEWASHAGILRLLSETIERAGAVSLALPATKQMMSGILEELHLDTIGFVPTGQQMPVPSTQPCSIVIRQPESTIWLPTTTVGVEEGGATDRIDLWLPMSMVAVSNEEKEDTLGKKHRKHKRIQVPIEGDATAIVEIFNEPFAAKLKNISLGGATIELRDTVELAPGQHIFLRIERPGLRLVVEAEIRWQMDNQYGLQFHPCSNGSAIERAITSIIRTIEREAVLFTLGAKVRMHSSEAS